MHQILFGDLTALPQTPSSRILKGPTSKGERGERGGHGKGGVKGRGQKGKGQKGRGNGDKPPD